MATRTWDGDSDPPTRTWDDDSDSEMLDASSDIQVEVKEEVINIIKRKVPKMSKEERKLNPKTLIRIKGGKTSFTKDEYYTAITDYFGPGFDASYADHCFNTDMNDGYISKVGRNPDRFKYNRNKDFNKFEVKALKVMLKHGLNTTFGKGRSGEDGKIVRRRETTEYIKQLMDEDSGNDTSDGDEKEDEDEACQDSDSVKSEVSDDEEVEVKEEVIETTIITEPKEKELDPKPLLRIRRGRTSFTIPHFFDAITLFFGPGYDAGYANAIIDLDVHNGYLSQIEPDRYIYNVDNEWNKSEVKLLKIVWKNGLNENYGEGRAGEGGRIIRDVLPSDIQIQQILDRDYPVETSDPEDIGDGEEAKNKRRGKSVGPRYIIGSEYSSVLGDEPLDRTFSGGHGGNAGGYGLYGNPFGRHYGITGRRFRNLLNSYGEGYGGPSSPFGGGHGNPYGWGY